MLTVDLYLELSLRYRVFVIVTEGYPLGVFRNNQIKTWAPVSEFEFRKKRMRNSINMVLWIFGLYSTEKLDL